MGKIIIKKKQGTMVRAKNVRFWMNASKAEVRASLGGTDEEWEIFAVNKPPSPQLPYRIKTQ